MESRPKIDAMSSLISPPEATPYESFSRSSPPPTMAVQSKMTFPKKLNHFLSPPISPETKTTGPEESTLVVKDPILYPNHDASSTTSSQPPLFLDAADATAQRVVDEHMSARALRKRQFREASPPNRDDYVLALEFKSQVAKMFNADRRAWQTRERQLLLEDQKIRNASLQKKLVPLRPSPSGAEKLRKTVMGARVAKPASAPRPRKVREPVIRRDRQEFGSATPEPGRSRNNVGSTREDKDFASLPDYSPPLSTLPNRPNSLKVEWKGAPIDLRNDPHRHLLHDDEVALAANLRLDCATYLTSKRRIFIARIECLRIGKEFRKTDSQQACKIDVNKASKLWAAFEKVGWLKAEYFRKYL